MARKRRRSAAKNPINWTLMLIMLACFLAGAATMWVADQGRIMEKNKQIDELRMELTIATGRDPGGQ